MSDHPYSRYNGSDLILRDHLAVDRTKLANERTMLAYLRTAVLLFGGAVTLIKFFPEETATLALGAFFTLLAAGMLIVGWMRYSRERKILNALLDGGNAQNEKSQIKSKQ